MSVYTKAQTYALATLRSLLCIRHDQMHWLIGNEYPGEKAHAAAQMRRLAHLGRVMIDARYYYWPGCRLDEELITALSIMRRMSGAEKPVFYLREPPCKLIFSFVKHDVQLVCGVFFPKPGEEWETSAAVEKLAAGHSAAIYLKNRGHIPRFSISHPHIFVCPADDGSFEYIGKAKGGD